MDAITEFEAVLNSITGLFVDSQDAFALLQAKVESEAEGRIGIRRSTTATVP